MAPFSTKAEARANSSGAGFRANEAGPPMIEREREIYYGRLEIARQYARLNGLNRIIGPFFHGPGRRCPLGRGHLRLHADHGPQPQSAL